MEACGSIREWDSPAGEAPHIVHGLAVVANRKGKLRMIVDARYLNAFLRYKPFHYEQLKDVISYLGEGYYMATLDFTSGYHHLLVRAEQQKYFGFALNGKIYVFRALCFGVAPACREFTEVVRTMQRPLRLVGMHMTALIDDVLLAARTKGEAMYLISMLIRLYVALGLHMGISKCIIEPQQEASFLGMLISSVEAVFRVPTDKLVDVIQRITAARDSPALSKRDLASIAGMVLALSPAVPLAPIYGKLMYQLMTCQADWDALADTPADLRQHLDFLLKTIPAANGKRWRKPEVATVLVGDASDHQYGGFTPHGELDAAFVQPFTASELDRMANNAFSSTLRETLNIQFFLESIQRHQPQLLQHKHVLYQSDNQGMVFDINKQGGTGEILRSVFSIHEQARALDCEISAEWHPREDQLQQHADMLSKLVDSTESSMNMDMLTAAVLSHTSFPRDSSGQPLPFTLDVYASRDSTKVPSRFYSRFYTEGSMGVNALGYTWASVQGNRQFCLINGPFGLMP